MSTGNAVAARQPAEVNVYDRLRAQVPAVARDTKETAA
jgi:hypothetical protein